MKKQSHKTMRGLLIVATASLAIASCSKDTDTNFPNNNGTAMNIANAKAPTESTCGTIPSDLNVPEGNTLASQAYASGVQIYQVQRSTVDPNTFVWVNIAPSATLYANPELTNAIGTHYKGPTWEFAKGFNKNEKVVATKQKAVTVDASAVPWLLLKAEDALSSAGNKVTYIQRICTAGGLAPVKPATEANLGETDSVPYTATYLFYTQQ